MHVEPFDSRDEVGLRSPMANCRKWMDPKDQTTLYKIISVLYSLSAQQLFPQEIASLYYRICKHIEKRVPSNILNMINIDPSNPNKLHPTITNFSTFQKPQCLSNGVPFNLKSSDNSRL